MNETENIHSKVKILKSPFILFIKTCLTLIIIGFFDVIVSFSIDFIELEIDHDSVFSYEEQFFFVSLLVQLIIIIYLFANWSSDYYYFSGPAILHKTGIFFCKIHTFEINKIDSVSTHQTLLGKLFDYGSVSLYFSNQKFLLKQIPDPVYFAKVINRYRKNLSKQKDI